MRIDGERTMLDVLEIRAMLLGEKYGLKPKDKLMLELLSLGKEPKEFAEGLGLSVSAVNNRLIRVRELFNASTTAHAVAEAIRRGIIE